MPIHAVGKNTRRLITEKGWTISGASDRSGIPLPTLKAIIYGTYKAVKTDSLEKLAAAFECNVDDLFLEDGQASQSYGGVDGSLLEICLEQVDLYLKVEKKSLSKIKLIKVVNNLASLTEKKRKNNSSYIPDKEVVEWIIENS